MLEDIKKTLWATADKLRANMDAAEYKHLVLGLIFVKYISDTFAARRAELTTRLTNPTDDYFFANATPADLEQELGKDPSNALLQELLINTYQDEMRALTDVHEASDPGRGI